MSEGTFITFTPGLPKPKTLTWFVHPKDSTNHIGMVKWYGPWRKYCFFPEAYTVFEKVCLREIADFCEQKTKGHNEILAK